MSKRILQLLFRDLKTVRITCKHPGCGMVMELPTDKLDEKFADMLCPFCRRYLFKAIAGESPFARLAEAFRQFTKAADMQIEFVADEPGLRPQGQSPTGNE